MKHTITSSHALRRALVACLSVLAAWLIAQGRPESGSVTAFSFVAIPQSIATDSDASVPGASIPQRRRAAATASRAAAF